MKSYVGEYKSNLEKEKAKGQASLYLLQLSRPATQST